MRDRTFGLSVDGATAVANARGKAFEKTLDAFCPYLPENLVLVKATSKVLPDEFRRKLSQFFALSSNELLTTRPEEPSIGDIYQEDASSPVKVWTGSKWKDAEEGIEPDRVLYCTKTGKAVLIEAKYGDTEGNAHIERAGARATPRFLEKIKDVFGDNNVRYLYVFSGPMVTTRNALLVDEKVGQRGKCKGLVVQTPEQRRFASAKYWLQMEVLFGNGEEPMPWDTMLWDDDGLDNLISLFENKFEPWFNKEEFAHEGVFYVSNE